MAEIQTTSRVTVTVAGETGTGKSRILAEIEVALKAAGVTVEFATIGDRREAEAEHWSVARSAGPVVEDWPVVLLREQNILREASVGDRPRPGPDDVRRCSCGWPAPLCCEYCGSPYSELARD